VLAAEAEGVVGGGGGMAASAVWFAADRISG